MSGVASKDPKEEYHNRAHKSKVPYKQSVITFITQTIYDCHCSSHKLPTYDLLFYIRTDTPTATNQLFKGKPSCAVFSTKRKKLSPFP